MATYSMLTIPTIIGTPPPILPLQNHDEDSASQLTEQQLHVWEHAALLYHGYEWQAAADTFAVLSRDIPCPQLRSFCLLNTAMILARMGDSDVAASVIQEAAQVDANSVIAVYLLAIVAYQLQAYSKAAYCFEICLEGFGCDEAIDYNDVGLHFALDREAVLDNLREVRAVQGRRGIAPNPIHAIPAEIIFEAPKRVAAIEVTTQDSQRRSSALGKLVSPVWRTSVLAESPNPQEHGDKSPVTPQPTPSCMTKALHPALRSPQPSITDDNFKLRLARPTEAKPQKQQRQSSPGRPRTPYTPRDARVISDSTTELARFIKKGGQINNMIPRDPRGEYEPVQELSTFAEAYAPDTLRSKTPEPFDLDPYFIARSHLAALLSERYDTGRRLGLGKNSPISDHPREQHSGEQLSLSNQSAATIPPACPEVPSDEILLSKVYKPPPKRIRDRRNGLYTGLNTAEQKTTQEKELLSPKSDSSPEQHKKRQRALALEALEGNKTFPPRIHPTPVEADGGRSRASLRSDPSSLVETEQFFDEILGRKERS